MSAFFRPRMASIAALPVSPLVAPTMVTRSPRLASTWSNSPPSTCIATSLKASVGPCHNSSRCRLGARASSEVSGAISGTRNVA